MLRRDDALQLIRSIAERSGATIEERTLGTGSSAEHVIELRLKPEKRSSQKSKTANSKRPRVLHVEDTDRTTNLVFYYLRASFDVDTEATAEGGLARALEGEYDYVILDMDTHTGMSGCDLAELLREMKTFERIPIIAMATYHSRKDVDRCMAAGCTAFLSKPFLKEDLLHLMEQYGGHTNPAK